MAREYRERGSTADIIKMCDKEKPCEGDRFSVQNDEAAREFNAAAIIEP